MRRARKAGAASASRIVTFTAKAVSAAIRSGGVTFTVKVIAAVTWRDGATFTVKVSATTASPPVGWIRSVCADLSLPP